MKKILLTLMLLLLPITASAADQAPAAQAAGTETPAPEQASAKPVLRIGTECTYAPFTYRDANHVIQGFDIDIAREVAARAGYEPEFICNPFDSSIPSLQARKFDILFTALSANEERQKTVDFSLPYRSSTARFAAAKALNINPFNTDGTPNTEALKGKTVGVQRSSTYDKYIKDKFPGVAVRQYDTVNNMILDLKSGRVDLVMAGPVNLWSTLLQKEGGENYTFIGQEVDNTDYFGIGIAAAMRKGDAKLLEETNKALQSMYDDGTFKTINLKYWDFTVLPAVWK